MRGGFTNHFATPGEIYPPATIETGRVGSVWTVWMKSREERARDTHGMPQPR